MIVKLPLPEGGFVAFEASEFICAAPRVMGDKADNIIVGTSMVWLKGIGMGFPVKLSVDEVVEKVQPSLSLVS